MVFQNARYLPWFSRTLGIYHGFPERSVFTMVSENPRYLPWFPRTFGIYYSFRKRSIFTMGDPLVYPPTRRSKTCPKTVSRSTFSWSFGGGWVLRLWRPQEASIHPYIPGASGSSSEPLGAPGISGSSWEPLGAPESLWESLGAPDSLWEPLGTPGEPLGAPGEPPGAPGESQGAPGEPLGAPGSSR